MRNINIVIPMAGRGQRFVDAGYEIPKPFIPINNKPMIEHVIENVIFHGDDNECKFHIIAQQEHIDNFGFNERLDKIFYETDWEYTLTGLTEMTEGAACTVLKVRDYINNDDDLVIANSDQLMDWDPLHFLKAIEKTGADGGLTTFYSSHPKWSYAKLDNDGWVAQIKEKEVISEYATIGLYHYSKGRYFVEAADNMIHRDLRVNGEFYVAPAYDYLINTKGHKILNYPIYPQGMTALGTPEDMEAYQNNLIK